MMRTCSPDSEPRYMHSGSKGKSEPCVHRESRLDHRCRERRERRQEREERKREEKRREEKRREEKRREEKRREEKRIEERREERKKEGQTERRKRARKKEKAENPSVCDSKRLHVCVQDASVCIRKTPTCVGQYTGGKEVVAWEKPDTQRPPSTKETSHSNPTRATNSQK